MKMKKVILSIIIISMIFMFIPTRVFAITAVYEYNKINMIISFLLTITGVISSISYIIASIIYVIKSRKTKKQKIKDILKWLIILLSVDGTLMWGAKWAYLLGKTVVPKNVEYITHTYYNNPVTLHISYIIRISAILVIIGYIIWLISYFVKAKREKKLIKGRNIIKWLIITVVSVVILLYIAIPISEIGKVYEKEERPLPSNMQKYFNKIDR